MQRRHARLAPLGALLLALNLLGVAAPDHATPAAAQGPRSEVTVGQDYRHDVSPPLRILKPPPATPGSAREIPAPLTAGQHQDQRDPVVQSPRAVAAMPTPILSIDGIAVSGASCVCVPPSPNGAAGLTQYVQTVNLGFQIFDKASGASVFGPAPLSTLWAGFGGVCQTNGFGDPTVLYDQLADRWLISQFAGSSLPTDECFAVSTTSDATGTYNRYGFHLGSNSFNFPRLAVWPDAYYLSMDVFDSSSFARLGPQPFAFDRAAMLAGSPATFVATGITGGATEETYLPANLDGKTLPPPGAPNSFVEWPSGSPLVYKLYHFQADFAVPANSTFTLFASLPAAAFTELCPATRACVPEVGVVSSDYLDERGHQLQSRLGYRNFGDHEALVTNYTVSSGGVAGIRWLEIRNATNGPVTVFQESTYQPDTTWRWMASAAMDRAGDLALGFSASSATLFPEIRYAGRLAGDPLNTLAQGEATLVAGTGSQTSSGNRWGDYSALAVDPVDDCTFWYTNEYYATTGSFSWRTRIGSFRFASCTSGPPLPTPTRTATPPACSPTTRFSENFDGVTPPGLPAGWTATIATGPAPQWVTSNAGSPAPVADTAPNAAFVDDSAAISDKRLDSPGIPVTTPNAQVTFRQHFGFEGSGADYYDGGVLEISIGGGAFADILAAGGSFVSGGYNGTISLSTMNPLAGRRAWGQASGGFFTTTAKLPPAAAGQSVKLRWRMGSDRSVGIAGWRIDTITVTDCVPITATPTRTPTATPTATRTPTVTPTLFPKPNVGVQVAPGGGTLQTTITARDAACSGGNNQLQSLQFTKLTNATVDVATSPVTTVSAVPTTVPLPTHPATIGLTMHRTTAGQAATVELIVTDGCGTWPTFVGGGPGAF